MNLVVAILLAVVSSELGVINEGAILSYVWVVV